MQDKNDDSYERNSIKDSESLLVKALLSDDYNEDEDNIDSNNKKVVEHNLPVVTNQNNFTKEVSAIDRILNNQNSMMDVASKAYTKGQKTHADKMANYYANENAQADIASNEKVKHDILNSKGGFLLNEINKNGELRLWKYGKDFYCQATKNSTIYKGNKDLISSILEGFIKKPIRIVSSKDITKGNSIKHNHIEEYIFTHQIPVIDKELFNPSKNDFFQIDSIWYKNKFKPTGYLQKRFNNIKPMDIYDGFIIELLENLVYETEKDDNSKPKTVATVEWFSRYFQTMQTPHIALVLNGSKDIEKIVWNKIIKPIFGYEKYCIEINDNTLQKPLSEIVEEKLFFNIEEFTPTEENIQKVQQLLQAIIIDKYVLTPTHPQNRVPVFGQALITADETLSYMQRYYTQFEYVYISDEKKVIDSLANGIIDLEIKFSKENVLEDFTDVLAVFNKNIDEELSVVSKIILKDEEETLDDKIESFIKAIKQSKKEYFIKLKDDFSDLYKEVDFAFDKGCFIGQDLFKYFNIVQGKEIFKTNTSLINVLKEKDEIFTQELTKLKALNESGDEEVLFDGISTYKEVATKKLYKIEDYILPKDIKVPKNWVIINRSGNQRFKYDHEDMGAAEEIHKKYDEDKMHE